MKIKTSHQNAQADFFVKNYLVFLTSTILVIYVWPKLLYLLGKSSWESPLGGGWLMYYTVGFYSILILYPISILLSFAFILFFNNQLMSGRKINKKTKFALFLLSIVFYVITILGVSFIYSLF